jgi:DNA-binding XRE family transcriptional regulator
MYDYSKLKGKIRELGITQNEYAKAIGITEQTLNLRLKNKRPFKQDEIEKTMLLFNEPLKNVQIYFFNKKVAKNRTN